MFSDGTHWVDGAPSEAPPPSHRRARAWLATAAIVVVLAGLLVPFAAVSAATLPGNRLIAQWSASHAVLTYQETSRRITYRGAWVRTYNSGYRGDRARSANRRGSRATFTFSGTAVSWIGPVGPSRGQANVYLNGRFVKTVNTYARSFKPSQVLFTATFSTMATRTLKIVVVGTRRHPRVAIDAFAVRGKQRVTTATASPTPTATPTASPTVTGIAVPSSIDATGGSDASAALISFVGAVPDGSTIVFKAGGIYRMDAALKFAHRHNLTFEGNGATLRSNGGTTEASSLFWLGSYLGGNTGIVIRNFSLVGNSSTPGVYQSGKEGAHGILVGGGSTIEVANVTIRGVWGDCFYVGGWANAVTFHDSTCGSNGRNGVTVTSATNLTVERVAFPKSGYCTFDIEPNVSTEGANNVQLLHNTAGTWTNSFLSADGAVGSVVNGVTVSGNTVTGASLLTIIDLARRQNIVFTNNTSTVIAAGPVLRFAHIDGLTVTGNVQPLRSGELASITDSTGVSYP